MYAIIRAGGRQIKVTPGAKVDVDGSLGEPGKEVTLSQVLLVEQDSGEIRAGAPYLTDVRVIGVVDGPQRGPKIRVFKKKRRKAMRRTKGHRAQFTRVMIKEIAM